jgi:hypothetical protein
MFGMGQTAYVAMVASMLVTLPLLYVVFYPRMVSGFVVILAIVIGDVWDHSVGRELRTFRGCVDSLNEAKRAGWLSRGFAGIAGRKEAGLPL